jgi:hypothetical protein
LKASKNRIEVVANDNSGAMSPPMSTAQYRLLKNIYGLMKQSFR